MAEFYPTERIVMRKVFEEILGAENVLQNELMSKHTTFKIGGAADWFLMPQTKEQIAEVLKLVKTEKLPCFILGNGSNLLVGDKGIRGIVICLYKKMDDINVQGDRIYVQSGALLSKLSNAALAAGLSGVEFASGIPGTVGGALFMNAGAYEHEISEVVETVEYMDAEGNIFEMSASQCGFGYRKSVFSENDYVILGCTLRLKKADKEEIKALIGDYTQRRVSKQPLEKPSAGSTFKRPAGYFAGGLIEQAQLKGYTIGGAQVSEKHAGFIINKGGATARDVLELIEYVKKTVFEMSGVMLEPEVKMIGEF